METRRDAVLAGLDVSKMRGIEIGALDSPLVSRDEGSIKYVDHVATSGLRIKYANDPNVNLERLVDVDFVWTDGSLEDITGNQKFDYVVASHVVERLRPRKGVNYLSA